MPTIETRVEPSIESLARLSKRHPGTTFRLLGWHVTDERNVYVLLEAPGIDLDTASEYLTADSDVLEYEVVHEADRALYVRLLIPQPAPYWAGVETGNVPHSTLTIRDGWIRGEMTTSMDRIQEFVLALGEENVRHEIDSLTRTRDDESFLTDRQRTVVETAVSHGYYRTPRGCTLSEIASALDVHRSTVGDVLNRAENRIVTAVLDESAP